METRRRIFIVDDSFDQRFALQETFRRDGYEVVTASDGAEALEVLGSDADFCAVILDVQMPGMDGFELAEKIRATPSLHLLPLIFLTSLGDQVDTIFEGYSLGAVDFLKKPADPVILRSKIRVFAELKSAQDRARHYAEQLEEKNEVLEKTVQMLNEAVEDRDDHARELESAMSALEVEKLRIRRMFSSYLDPAVVDALVDDSGMWEELGGRECLITPFFSDMWEFSRISEVLDPGELSDLLLAYLDPMSAIIRENKGVRERYVGDAIVAFFGAPIPTEDHALKAAWTALQQMETLERLRQEWTRDARPFYTRLREAGLEVRFRVGLATGLACVGNFGTREVMSYSMNGDVVNLASRLETTNKVYGSRILVDQETRDRTDEVFVFRWLDTLLVPGKTHRVPVHELLAARGNASAEDLAFAFSAARAAKEAGEYQRALSGFEDLARRFPQDAPTRHFIERCQQKLASAP